MLNLMKLSGVSEITLMIILAFSLSTILIVLSYVLSAKASDSEKLSPYECGFEPFNDSGSRFDIKFYLVSLLFILFDLEVTFLFPLVSLDIYSLTPFSLLIAGVFVIFLTVGFIYEYSQNALDNL